MSCIEHGLRICIYMDYTALDFETANAARTSACSIGLSRFVDGRCVETKHVLLKPEPFFFHWGNVMVHGITPEAVRDAPTFADAWQELRPYLDGQLLVAHNAPFDIPVLHSLLRHYDLSFDQSHYVCTLALARALWGKELPSYRLNYLSQHFDITLEHHHAGSDARAAGLILQQIMRHTRHDTIEELCSMLHYKPAGLRLEGYDGFRKER